MDIENDLQSTEVVPAKSVADGESNPELVAGAFTADVDEEKDLQS